MFERQRSIAHRSMCSVSRFRRRHSLAAEIVFYHFLMNPKLLFQFTLATAAPQ
jgi:hypothetical protein